MSFSCGGPELLFVIINCGYPFMGIVEIIVGGQALSNVSNINTDHITPLLDSIKMGSIQAGSMVNTLSIINIVIGVLILVVAGLGFIGALKENKYMLVTYAILILILLVMKIVVIALWFTMKSKVEKEMKNKMLEALNANFKEDTIANTDSISNAWNYMFMTLDCCGVNPVVSTTNDFDQTSWCTTSGSCQSTNSQIPRTCCLNVDENTYSSAPSGCHASVNSGTYNAKGCYDVLENKLLSESFSVLGVAITIILFEIVAVIFAFLICCRLGDDTVGLAQINVENQSK